MAEPLDFDALQREALLALFGRIVVIRLALTPVLLTIISTAVWLDPAPWRAALGAALATTLLTVGIVEYVRWSRGWSGAESLPVNAAAMFLLQLGAVILTGGLDSPILPVLPMAALQAAVTLGWGRAVGVVVAAQLAAIWGLVALYLRGVVLALPQLGPVAHAPAWPWVAAVALSVLLCAAVGVGNKLRLMIARMIRQTIGAHDSERRAHAEHARELVALSGEIAHELKNPLASVKGLAALLARDLDGKSAERLAVLRAEVDRMQETLDEFLNFSRPLVPLAQEHVSLRELAGEVVALCEGLARVRGVQLTAEETALHLQGDRRKLRQVLVNLVQNAIDAAPPGTEVVIAARRDGSAALEVLDRGAGVPTELAAFEAGVTTKPRGSGLGLTIARALVHQHGGAIALLPREGGGTCARVTLPAAGAA